MAREVAEERNNTGSLATDYQKFIHLSKYSRFDWTKMRRETWKETVERWRKFFDAWVGTLVTDEKKLAGARAAVAEAAESIEALRLVPSMRSLMTAGPALEKNHLAGYNCSFVAINRVQAFDEVLYILACGTGVGFSVERQHVNQLPTVAEDFYPSEIVIRVPDSKEGWAKSLKEVLSLLYQGQIPKWDTSGVRKKGSPLMTFGGRASGPEPLEKLFKFAVALFQGAAGRKLTSLECHDLVCKVADAIVSGGVRRSALISLSNLSDDRMRGAKMGDWMAQHRQREMANNSAVYTEKPEVGLFMQEWKALYDSKSGERGIFNRQAAKLKCELIGRNPDHEFGTNPCGEIILRDRQLCNLSEVIIRPTDSEEVLADKVRIAAFIGTLQSTLTNFKYVSKRWRENCEEERLLGVSLTGIFDNPLTDGSEPGLEGRLGRLRKIARDTNEEWAKVFGIPASAAVTCVKPSGTASLLADCSSGIHPAFYPYFVRRAQLANTDPVLKMLRDLGVPTEPHNGKPDTTSVVTFPMKSPAHATFLRDVTAIGHLELWKKYRNFWCDHNPSVSINVREHEWMSVGAWVYDNFDSATGISFFPYADNVYDQAPFEEVTREQYEKLLAELPKNIDWGKIALYENEDMTESAQNLACASPEGCAV